jgi:glycosyltransferase involved in cell wall biosynthesis
MILTNTCDNDCELIKGAKHGERARISAIVWIDRSPNGWIETLVSLLKNTIATSVYVGMADEQYLAYLKLEHPRLAYLPRITVTDLVDKAFEDSADQYLFVTAPIVAPLNALDTASNWMMNDPRIGTVSFLSNSAGYLSFPHRNSPTPYGVDGHNHDSLTKLLRTGFNESHLPVPLPIAEGGAVLISRSAISVAGNIDDMETQNLQFGIAEFSLRAARRGFNNFLDASTFIACPWDGVGTYTSVLENADSRHALHQIHGHFPGCYDLERHSTNSVIGHALDFARAKASGLRVLIDGSVLGPQEMGTQQLILQLTLALSKHADVQWVAVGVPDEKNVPDYAHQLTDSKKIRLVSAANLNFDGCQDVDIIHRPFQPTGAIPWNRWRGLAKRTVITIQDLIAYRNAAYFRNWEEWGEYRRNMRLQIQQADSIFCISNDVLNSIAEERIAVSNQNLFVVENGADARSKEQPQRIPYSLVERGWEARAFILVLGATYAHKNRDLAIRVWQRLKEKGLDHALILVGASVPFGSTRNEEAFLMLGQHRENILTLPEVSAEERNWLLRNASLVAYLTAAEGFGLVPFEAACMGVPTLHVSFGPLRELIDDVDVPISYDLDVLTSRAEMLLSDRQVISASVTHVLKSAEDLSWARTAEKTIAAYYKTLGQPVKYREF